MRFDAWKFSAQLAWQDRFVRIVTLVTALEASTAIGYFLWRMIPAAEQSGVLIFHYTVYLGIDDVRPWSWVFVPTGIALGLSLLNAGFAFGVYRSDALAAKALLAFTSALLCLWTISVFFLVRVNI